MRHHFKGDPGFSNDWWGRDPIEEVEPEPEPELVQCDLCLKDFYPDHDNQHRGSNGSIYFCCDKCMSYGLHTREGRRWS